MAPSEIRWDLEESAPCPARSTMQAKQGKKRSMMDTSALHLGNTRLLPILAAAVVGIYGCTPLPATRPAVPAIPIPTQFKQAAAIRADIEPRRPNVEKLDETQAAAAATQSEALTGDLLAQWWRYLSNPELDALIDRAIANNADLHISTLRIVQAKARYEQAEAGRWPTLSIPFQAEGKGPSGGIGTLQPGQKRDTRHIYQMSLRADWRVDIWGERSALAESAQMQLLRSTYERDDVRRQLVANTASLYVEYLALNDRIRVARETETVLRGMLDSVSKRLEIGDATATEFEQQRTAVYQVQSTIPALELQRETIANALAQLLGVTPITLALSDRGLDSLTFPGVLPGIPSSLVLRRPDIRVVEARLLSEHAEIEVARARLLPPLDLTAQVGYGSFVLSQLFKSHSLFWNAIANISATIFDRGKRANEVVFANALHEELTETYIKTIYNAVRETEDAIATVQMTGKRIEAQAESVNAAYRAWRFSMESYEAGAVDFLTLIDTERTYHRSLDELYRIRMDRVKGVVALFSALGGGVTGNGYMAPAPETAPTRHEDGTTVPPYRKYVAKRDDENENRWFVELAGLHDRAGIAHVWDDLNRRYPALMDSRSLLPRLQGRVNHKDDRARSYWYRLYVAHFEGEEAAQAFCDQLTLKLQRCRIASFGEINPFDDEGDTQIVDVDPEATLVRANLKQEGTQSIPTNLVGDLIVPLTFQPVADTVIKPGRLEVAPTGRIVTPEEFLPSLIVPLVIDRQANPVLGGKNLESSEKS